MLSEEEFNHGQSRLLLSTDADSEGIDTRWRKIVESAVQMTEVGDGTGKERAWSMARLPSRPRRKTLMEQI